LKFYGLDVIQDKQGRIKTAWPAYFVLRNEALRCHFFWVGICIVEFEAHQVAGKARDYNIITTAII